VRIIGRTTKRAANDWRHSRSKWRCQKKPGESEDGTNQRILNVRFWPILLKNSLFEDNEKLLAHLTDLLFFDTRGYGSRSKARCGATGAVRYKKRIGFTKCLVLGKKFTFLKFGVFQHNRPGTALRGGCSIPRDSCKNCVN